MTKPMLTTPEGRARRIIEYGWKLKGMRTVRTGALASFVKKEICAALKELVEVAWERAPVNSDDDTFIDIELLTEIVNEVLPEKEQIK